MRTSTLALVAAVAASVALAAPSVKAAPIMTPDGSPFPDGSELLLTPAGGGSFQFLGMSIAYITITGFSGSTVVSSNSSGNEIFKYTGVEFAGFTTGGTEIGPIDVDSNGFVVRVSNRAPPPNAGRGLNSTGTFNADVLSATFTGSVGGTTVSTSLTGLASGTVTYTRDSNLDLFVDQSTWTVPGQFCIDRSCTRVPLNATFTGVSEPTTMAVLGLAVTGLVAARRRRAA